MVKTFIFCLCFLSISVSASDLIREKAEKAIDIKYTYDCDNLVDSIRSDSRMRMSDGISLEQINDRVTEYISKKKVDCLGYAKFSDSTTVRLRYGGKIDENNEWIFYYKKY